MSSTQPVERPHRVSRSPRREVLQSRGSTIVLLGGIFAATFLLPLLGGTDLRICPFYLITGLPCPGCGLGRSFCALSAGELDVSLRFHLLGPALYVLMAATLIKNVVEVLLGRRLSWPVRLPSAWVDPVLMVALGIVLCLWVVRLTGLWPLPGPGP